eukprot:scaffold3064_cov63-Phaeocystis_antarctica.AAC.5
MKSHTLPPSSTRACSSAVLPAAARRRSSWAMKPPSAIVSSRWPITESTCSSGAARSSSIRPSKLLAWSSTAALRRGRHEDRSGTHAGR